MTDPVCGMPLSGEHAEFTSAHKGINYYFCSERCKGEFDRDPRAVLAMKEERERVAEEERSESLEKMMDRVAHEIRNPLTSIGGFTRRIYERLPENDPNKKYLKIVIDDVARLESMIRRLIQLKAVDMLHAEPSDVNKIIKATLESFEEKLKGLNVQVKTDLMEDLPMISIDRYRMTTAFTNLVENAIEAMERPLKILEIASRTRDSYVEITISDTGKGIHKDSLRYVFDPFFTSKVYGPGLGLTFARSIIEEHKGTLLVDSEPGKGTKVTVRLPLKIS